ncbi:MAG: CinA family nicotinamide mononucleotide deamidase-related protein [Candidatus Omnitrophica bacterium]|nr:CinA family nicotinamide mononucleotide deamidase-related protein [Candidatus Omnitrophota bacterium]
MPKRIISKSCRIEVVCIGSELLYDRINTDINIISGILGRAGFSISRCVIAGDDRKEIMDAVGSSVERSRITFVTGGLGPTSDDITKESIAELLRRKLIFSEEIWDGICRRFYARGVKNIPEINKKQAYAVEGSEILKNEVGTAPGLLIKEGEKTIVILPGPPVELAPMAEQYVKKLKREKKSSVIKIRRFGISGIPESAVEEEVNPILKNYGAKYTILAHPQMIEILISSDIAPAKLRDFERRLKKRFGDGYLGVNPPSLPEILAGLLKRKKLTAAFAESCTGGLAGKLITDIPGSSDFFRGSFVVYGNILKRRILKVPKTVIKKYGAVSEQTAMHMAKGAKKAGKSEVSLSITGIAGPSGGSEEKPVGLVCIGIGMPKNRFYAYKFLFSGNRERIRERAVYQGFDLLRKHLNEK